MQRSTDSPSRARLRERLLRLGLIVGSGVFALYAAEVVFRRAILVPSVPRTPAQFRKIVASNWPRPVEERKEPGTVRILGLADSFGLAGGERNYHFLVEETFRSRGYPVEAVNFSVGAYSLVEELRLLREFGRRFEPDIVLHGFFVGNDFAIPTGESMRLNHVHVETLEGIRSWYPGNLMLFRWLARWRRGQRETNLAVAAGIEGTFSRDTFLEIERVRMTSCRRQRSEGPAWPGTTRLLDEIRSEVRKLDAHYVLVVHPDQFQVEPALAEEIVETFDLDRADYDLGLPLRFLHAYAESRGVVIVDLTPHFRAAGREGGLYLPRDTHYSAMGNELAARLIVEALEPLLPGK